VGGGLSARDRKRKGLEMELDEKEIRLIISSLEADTLGAWGDGRGEAIEKLIKKIKREGGKK